MRYVPRAGIPALLTSRWTPDAAPGCARRGIDGVAVGDVAELDLAADLVRERTSRSSRRATRTQCQPFSASSRAVASPMPDGRSRYDRDALNDLHRAQVDLDRVADVLRVAAGERNADRHAGRERACRG